MGSWKQQIEAQIAKCREKYHGGYADTMQALLDVAVAANEYEIWCIKVGIPINKRVQKALDKLREVSE